MKYLLILLFFTPALSYSEEYFSVPKAEWAKKYSELNKYSYEKKLFELEEKKIAKAIRNAIYKGDTHVIYKFTISDMDVMWHLVDSLKSKGYALSQEIDPEYPKIFIRWSEE